MEISEQIKREVKGLWGEIGEKGKGIFFKEMNSVIKFRRNWSKNLAANNIGEMSVKNWDFLLLRA